MKSKGLLPKKDKTENAKNTAKGACSMTEVELTAEIKRDLDWLKSFREPWSKVKDKWARTSGYRLFDLSKTEGPVSDYTNKYKQLQLEKGHELIGIDFSKIHPGKEDVLSQNWEDFRKKIITMLDLKKSVNDAEGKILRNALANCSDDTKDMVILQLLPSLVPPSRLVRIGSKRIKPFIKECRNAFVVTEKLPNQVHPMIKERREVASKLGKGATVQPYIIVVSPDSRTLNGVYVIIDLFAYKMSSVLEGLDICFKAFYALNSKYPTESEDIWLVIQKALYDISSPNDPNILYVKSFLKRLTVMEIEEE